MIGEQVSHYRITEQLGRGGMGVVYKALDTKLGRTVALKFLPPDLVDDSEAKQRFIQEAKAASSLDHPNICTIYEIGQADDGRLFIAMAYYSGGDLAERIASGWLEREEALRIAAKIAGGLARAHKQGIIHRDIKPANIMFSEDGEVKVVDFGLAKLAGASRLTSSQTTLGTVVYMSPEQAMGGELDQRSDVWSLGVILYEMLTGRLPYDADYYAALFYKIINEEPAPATELADSPELQAVLGNALAKNRKDRYCSAEHLLGDVESLIAGSGEVKPVSATSRSPSAFRVRPPFILAAIAAAILGIIVIMAIWRPWEKIGWGPEGQPSIAVLAFTNMSPDPDQEYFCDGISEEILNKLANIEGLRVIARTSSFQFKGRDLDIPEIGRRLEVSTVLEGSVRKSGDMVRITAQLINVADNSHIWSRVYNRRLQDVFAVQDEIAMAIVNALRLNLGFEDQRDISKRNTNSPEALSMYGKGSHHLSAMRWREALDYFELAAELDSDFALAYVGIAACHELGVKLFEELPSEAFQKVEENIGKALSLDPQIGDAYAVRANMRLNRDFDWDGAEADYRLAMALSPNSPIVHSGYAWLMLHQGRFEQAEAEAKLALELNPLFEGVYVGLAYVYYCQGKSHAAAELMERALAQHPDFELGWGALTYILAGSGQDERAFEVLKEFMARMNLPIIAAFLDQVYEQEGFEGVLRAVSEPLGTRFGPFYRAAVQMFLGEHEQALDFLEQAEPHRDLVLLLNVDPVFEPLHGNPRFDALLRRMRLIE